MTKQKKPPDRMKCERHTYNFHALYFFSNESELILDFSGFIDWSSIVSDILARSFYLFTLGCGFVFLVGCLPTFRSEGRIFFILDSAPFCLSSASTFCFEDDNAFSTSLPLQSVNHAVCVGDIDDGGQVRKIFFLCPSRSSAALRGPFTMMRVSLKLNSIA